MGIFRNLTPEEEKEFRQWARDNYRPLESIRGTWHPVIQAECVKMNIEADCGITMTDVEDMARFILGIEPKKVP